MFSILACSTTAGQLGLTPVIAGVAQAVGSRQLSGDGAVSQIVVVEGIGLVGLVDLEAAQHDPTTVVLSAIRSSSSRLV
jgi:hypothetical protein